MWRNKAPVCVLVLGLASLPATAVADQVSSPGGDRPTGGALEPGPATAESKPTCEVTTMVEFRRGSARLSPAAKESLDRVVAAAKTEAAPRTVKLRASVPPTRKGRASARLTERRTEAVKGYLAERGVDPTSITITTDGETPPLTVAHAMEVFTCVAPVAAAPPAPPAPLPAPSAPPAETPPAIAVPSPPPAAPAEPTPATPPSAAASALPEMAPATEPVRAEADRQPMTRIGVGAMLGGGVTGFIDEQSRAFTDPGGSWEARASVGTRSWLALEAAYIGKSQNISALGLDSDANLIGNGAEATARFNFTRRAIQPYVFGGVGWEHYTLQKTGENTSSLRESDDVMTVPAGLGVSFRLARSLLLDVRGTARATFDDELMDGPYANTDQDARLHSWNAGARLGWEF